MQSTVVLTDGMAFEADVEGFTVSVDANREYGGQGKGPRPKALVLAALAGCTAMDVISILRKMRVQVDQFEVEATGEMVDTHPKVFSRITVTYRLRGPKLPGTKVARAVELSEERYCPVNAMLRPSVELKRVIVINGSPLVEQPTCQ